MTTRTLRNARKRYQRAWRSKNPSYSREYARQWAEDNKEEINAKRRARRVERRKCAIDANTKNAIDHSMEESAENSAVANVAV